MLALLGLVLATTAPLHAQDSLIVLDPGAPAGDSVLATGLPANILHEVLLRFNDSATTRLTGDFILPAGSRLGGAFGAHRGTIRIHGAVGGPITVVNGDLVLGPTARVTGDVLVVGGRISLDEGAVVEGGTREFPAEAPVSRSSNGTLVEREPGRSLEDLAAAQATFAKGDTRATLRLATAGTYNRIEGLPIVFGPRLEWQPAPDVYTRFDAMGVLRTAGNDADLLSDLGFNGRAEARFGRPWRLRLVGEGYSRVEPVSEYDLSAGETGWYAFLVQRDYRDYFDARGGGLTATFAAARQLRIMAGGRLERERTILANDPFSLFNNEDSWRPNPLIDDGEYLTWKLGFEVDTRPSSDLATTGVFARVGAEFTSGSDVAPVDLPTTVRDPLPTDGSYAFTRANLDLRGYYRLDRRHTLSGRFLADGWLGGDPLSLQRRVALGGPGLLPGYAFRAFDCSAESGHVDPAKPALCDRMMLAQGEMRRRFRLGLTHRIEDAEREGVDRVVGIEEADFVVFADLGTAWLAGDGPGRVPTGRVPSLSDWHADIGVGLATGGLGIYLAKALEEGEPVRLSIRLRRRF